MAEFRLALGAVADVASSQEVADCVSGLQGHIDRKFNSLGKVQKPFRRKLVASGAVSVPFGGANALILPFGDSPAIERTWVVRSLVVFDSANPFATQSKTGYLAVGNASAPSVSDFIGDRFTAIPFADTYNTSSVMVKPNETVYVVFDSTTTGILGATLEIDDWMSDAFEGQRI